MQMVESWSPANITCEKGVSDFQYADFDFGGWIAQSVEQRTENPCVGGSIPSPATTFLGILRLGNLCLTFEC